MADHASLRYKRVLLKISGEALMGDQGYGIDVPAVTKYAEEIKSAIELGCQICLVIGGGNIWRGKWGVDAGMERAQADHMGMLATVMNALVMQNSLESIGVPTRVQSGIPMMSICRTVHPPPCDPPHGKGPRRDLRGGHRQSVLHDRHGRSAARCRDELRCDAERHAGRRRLHV